MGSFDYLGITSNGPGRRIADIPNDISIVQGIKVFDWSVSSEQWIVHFFAIARCAERRPDQRQIPRLWYQLGERGP